MFALLLNVGDELKPVMTGCGLVILNFINDVKVYKPCRNKSGKSLSLSLSLS